VAVDKVAEGQWLLTLSGANDLDRFTTQAGAQLHFYLPGTVRSNQVIFIPSEIEAREQLALRYVPSMDDLTRLLQVGGVDGALTEQGDILITPDGGWPYVQGMAALIQWGRVALSTRRRSVPLHPEFGLDVQAGQSLADVSAQGVLESVRATFQQNPAFTGVNSALVELSGPACQVTLELGVKGVDALLPVSFPVAQ
jgi:hypothetical protein